MRGSECGFEVAVVGPLDCQIAIDTLISELERARYVDALHAFIDNFDGCFVFQNPKSVMAKR